MTCSVDPFDPFSDLFPWSGGESPIYPMPLPDTVDVTPIPDPPVYTAQVGALAPEGLVLALTNADLLAAADGSTLDFTTATAAAFAWSTETGVTGSWSATISDAAADAITLTYLYQAEDIAEAQRMRVIAVLTYPGGQRRTGWFTLTIWG